MALPWELYRSCDRWIGRRHRVASIVESRFKMIGKNRYAILTVDTEALPKRASKDHVARLMWGEHEEGRAGVAEMSAIGDEFGAKHLFFVDLCGAYSSLGESLAVVRWLNSAGQDVQLHTHPEYLPDAFGLSMGCLDARST